MNRIIVKQPTVLVFCPKRKDFIPVHALFNWRESCNFCKHHIKEEENDIICNFPEEEE